MPETLTMTTGLIAGGGLTLVGLVVSLLVWRARGAAAGLRGVAWSLLPLAAGLLGLMNAVWQFLLSVVGILVGLVFNPLVWAGVAVAALAAVLYVVSGFMRARGVGTKDRAAGGEVSAKRPERKGAAPAAGAAGQVGPAGGGKKDDDLGDIEDLLRKHGIE